MRPNPNLEDFAPPLVFAGLEMAELEQEQEQDQNHK
jgi:hypothetical protein